MCKISKVCSACGIERLLSNFQKDKISKDGFRGKCKSCMKNKIKVYDSELTREFKKCNCCKINKKLEEFGKNASSKDGYKYKCKKCYSTKTRINKVIDNTQRCYICKVYKNIEEFWKDKSTNNGVSSKCKHCSYIYIKNRLENNPKFKLKVLTRSLINNSFKRVCKNKYKKSKRTEEILGCTMSEFFIYIQSLFTEGMTIENNGQCEECWHFDHIIPLVSAKTEEEIIKLCHYTNFQPLWSRENLSKGKKLI